ncbi:MAG TPA: lactonase family protein [Terriglobales bacterium]|jgi:6-phosphogluconolactonase|nr:lactonase family protein [Terriglobales bacterium]
MTIFHRHCLLWFLVFSSVAVSAGKDSPKRKYLLFVGTYTEKESKGIYAYSFDAASSELTPLGVAAETSNPSFLAIDPSRRFLYAVNEVQKYKDAKSGVVSAFAIDGQKGKLQPLNAVASGGADPCYISFDKTGKYALVANYTGGSVAVFPVQSDGRIGEASAFVQHVGSSVNRERQEGPHAHWIETTPDNRFAIAVDLGLDELLVYRFDAKTGSLTPNDPPYARLDPGAGPRHLAFHPNGKFVYVVNELQSSITAFAYDASRGMLDKLTTVSTLPKNFSGGNDAAEIKIESSGRFLFASNRGHDTIAVFSIDGKTGALTLVDDFPTQGKTPRNFEIDPTGKFLFVANQDTNNIAVFQIDSNSGRLSPTKQTLQVPSPVCLKFMVVE